MRSTSTMCVLAALVQTFLIGLFILGRSGVMAELFVADSSGERARYATAPYVYYGPQKEHIPRTPAVFMNGPDVCNADPSALSGFIVTSDFMNSPCTRYDVYGKFSRAGVRALVAIDNTALPLGMRSHVYDSWDRNAHTRSSMTMVEAADMPIPDDGDLYMEISPPHDTEFADLYDSWLWLLFNQVLLPLLALWAAMVAFGETRRQQLISAKGSASPVATAPTSNRHIAPTKIMCILEGASMLCTSVLMACGMYGPHVLRFQFFGLFFTMLQGCQTFACFVLVSIVQEKKSFLTMPRTLPARSAVPSFFSTHRTTFIAASFASFSVDIITAWRVSGARLWVGTFYAIAVASMGASLLLLFISGILCMTQARSITAIRTSCVLPEDKVCVLKHVAFWLHWNGIVVIMQVSAFACILMLFESRLGGAYTMGFFIFLLQVLRCFKAVAQTQALKPFKSKLRHAHPIAWLWTSVSMHSTVCDDTYPSFHESRDSYFAAHPSGNLSNQSTSGIPTSSKESHANAEINSSLNDSPISSKLAGSGSEEKSWNEDEGEVEMC